MSMNGGMEEWNKLRDLNQRTRVHHPGNLSLSPLFSAVSVHPCFLVRPPTLARASCSPARAPLKYRQIISSEKFATIMFLLFHEADGISHTPLLVCGSGIVLQSTIRSTQELIQTETSQPPRCERVGLHLMASSLPLESRGMLLRMRRSSSHYTFCLSPHIDSSPRPISEMVTLGWRQVHLLRPQRPIPHWFVSSTQQGIRVSPG